MTNEVKKERKKEKSGQEERRKWKGGMKETKKGMTETRKEGKK